VPDKTLTGQMSADDDQVSTDAIGILRIRNVAHADSFDGHCVRDDFRGACSDPIREQTAHRERRIGGSIPLSTSSQQGSHCYQTSERNEAVQCWPF
jgi:hypothetical protein